MGDNVQICKMLMCTGTYCTGIVYWYLELCTGILCENMPINYHAMAWLAVSEPTYIRPVCMMACQI